MQLKITDKKEEILLSRTKIKAELIFTGAVPSQNDVRKEIAAQLKVDEKLVVVRKILCQFKCTKAKVLAYAYINEEDMKKVELKAKKKKEKKKEAEAKKE